MDLESRKPRFPRFGRSTGEKPPKEGIRPGERKHSLPIEFSVDDVKPAAEALPVQSLDAVVAERLQRHVFILPEPLKPVVQPTSRDHPLIDAVHEAFSHHRPLTLSPDAIWLVIAQGFSHHILLNAEALRSRLVRHQGVRELSALINAFNLPQIRTAIASFSEQIRAASDPVLHETLVCDFSTTTPDIRTASEVVLMDSYSSYFQYVMHCICGIPKVTLTGSPEDWQRIRDRVEVLETFDLGWWISRLRPILNQFVQTANGQPNREFWQAIYKPKSAYAVECVTGWIADLFPYLGDDPPTRKHNRVFDHKRENWAMPVDKGVPARRGMIESGSEKGTPTSSFPSGLSRVPVKVLGIPKWQEVDFVAGFLGVEQDPQTLSLSPVISWSVTQRAPAEPILVDRWHFYASRRRLSSV